MLHEKGRQCQRNSNLKTPLNPARIAPSLNLKLQGRSNGQMDHRANGSEGPVAVEIAPVEGPGPRPAPTALVVDRRR